MRSRPFAFSILALALAACVTINVYFPEAAIKDLSEQIEEEIQKQAAEEAAPQEGGEPAEQAEPPVEQSSARGSVLDLLLGVTPAYAQSVPAPEVSNPAIRKIIDSRAQRLPDLQKYKAAGAIGENNQGLVEIVKLDALSDLRARAEAQRLVKAENADREALYKEIAAAEGVDLSQLPRIRETYAETLRNNAGRGEWIQTSAGEWRQKK